MKIDVNGLNEEGVEPVLEGRHTYEFGENLGQTVFMHIDTLNGTDTPYSDRVEDIGIIGTDLRPAKTLSRVIQAVKVGGNYDGSGILLKMDDKEPADDFPSGAPEHPVNTLAGAIAVMNKNIPKLQFPKHQDKELVYIISGGSIENGTFLRGIYRNVTFLHSNLKGGTYTSCIFNKCHIGPITVRGVTSMYECEVEAKIIGEGEQDDG